MRFGMPTLMELPDVNAAVDLCRGLGLSFIEINMNLPAFCPQNLPPETLRQITLDTGIGFTLHLPEELDMASIHPVLRDAHIRLVQEAMQWAGKAGVSILNLHLNEGVHFTLPDRRAWVYETHANSFVGRVLDTFDGLLKTAREHGLQLCVENCNFHRPYVRKAIEALVQMDGFRLTWDTGHNAGTGYLETPILERYSDLIAHMHIHDFSSARDHQVLFSGTVNLDKAIHFASSRDIGAVIETKTIDSITESVRRLRDRGYFDCETRDVAPATSLDAGKAGPV
jgi:sugar phosphate isomerase/epimerase